MFVHIWRFTYTNKETFVDYIGYAIRLFERAAD